MFSLLQPVGIGQQFITEMPPDDSRRNEEIKGHQNEKPYQISNIKVLLCKKIIHVDWIKLMYILGNSNY